MSDQNTVITHANDQVKEINEVYVEEVISMREWHRGAITDYGCTLPDGRWIISTRITTLREAIWKKFPEANIVQPCRRTACDTARPGSRLSTARR